jgi:hypothetical protein
MPRRSRWEEHDGGGLPMIVIAIDLGFILFCEIASRLA